MSVAGSPPEAVRAEIRAADVDQAEQDSSSQAALQAVRLALKGKHDAAGKLRSAIEDPAALALLQWLAVRSSKSGAGFEEIAAFLKAHANWPQSNLVRARAEVALFSDPVATDRVLKHFEAYPARTGYGMIAHARALLETGKKERARKLIQTAWREHDFATATEGRLRNEFKAILTGDDHRARLVRQIYTQRTSAAVRTASYISTSHITLVKAAASLFRRHRRALRNYRLVPAQLRNQLVMQYALARYHRRRGQSDKARAIVLKAPGTPEQLSYPQAWWEERWALIRVSLAKDKPEQWPQAYQMAKAHGLTEGVQFVQGEFMAGWISLQFLKKPETAAAHFERILERDDKPLNVAQAHYWLGRCHRAMSDEDTARQHFEAAGALSNTFYGQLALDALGRGNAPLPVVAGPEVTAEAAAALAQNEQVRALKLLAEAGAERLLAVFFKDLADTLEDPGERAALAALAVELKQTWLSVRVAKISAQRGARLERFAYPIDAMPTITQPGHTIERAIVYAVARQESEFNASAVSPAGALGLMQLMPGTARHVSKDLGVSYRKAALTTDPSYNLKLGTTYLGGLLERFNGSYIAAIAGYNAGPGRVAQWNKRYGDLQKGEIEPVDWIESIPFNETRNYVKRVLETVQVYRALFGVEPEIPLTADLARGSILQARTPTTADCLAIAASAPDSTLEVPIACN